MFPVWCIQFSTLSNVHNFASLHSILKPDPYELSAAQLSRRFALYPDKYLSYHLHVDLHNVGFLNTGRSHDQIRD